MQIFQQMQSLNNLQTRYDNLQDIIIKSGGDI
jgi:hypothetical protein